jgi:YaiO family outer membrane protein
MSPMYRWMLLALLGTPLSALAADPAPALPNEIEAGFSRYSLTNGYADWDSAYLDAAHKFGERHSVYGQVQQAGRFNLVDREISGGYYQPLGPNWTAQIEASASAEHHFLPQNSLFGKLQASLGDGWDVQAGLRHSAYTLASTNTGVLTGERYWGNFRAAYRLYLSRLQGSGTAASHVGQLAYYYSEKSNVTLTVARGRQTESLGPGLGVLLLDVRSVSLTGRHWLNAAWALSFEAISESQGSLYTRTGIRLGLRHAF